MTSTAINPLDLRKAFGRFATGVTVVTTCVQGEPLGFTANSFASVSMAPPLVSWNYRKAAFGLSHFLAAEYFAVNVLGLDQQHLSTQFATGSGPRFAGVSVRAGLGQVPVIEGCSATFECRLRDTLEAGDHVIFVGEVLRYEHDERPPLVFHAGGYSRLAAPAGLA
jgi:3-hydroxy-9,10-secoandrosta-1,3,5(10)-triene-9,17-dione monooxygenase reductase component